MSSQASVGREPPAAPCPAGRSPSLLIRRRSCVRECFARMGKLPGRSCHLWLTWRGLARDRHHAPSSPVKSQLRRSSGCHDDMPRPRRRPGLRPRSALLPAALLVRIARVCLVLARFLCFMFKRINPFGVVYHKDLYSKPTAGTSRFDRSAWLSLPLFFLYVGSTDPAPFPLAFLC